METSCLAPTIPVDGGKVRELRIYRRHLSVTSLAEEVGLTRQHLHAIESGRQLRIRPELFGRLRDALRVEDPSDLLANQPELVASHK